MMLQLSDAVELEAKLFRGFADRSRLLIMLTLQDGPKTVSEIVSATGLAQPNVSNHLGCLRECALVRALPKGRNVEYSLSDARIGILLKTARGLLADVAAEIHACANFGKTGKMQHG